MRQSLQKIMRKTVNMKKCQKGEKKGDTLTGENCEQIAGKTKLRNQYQQKHQAQGETEHALK